MSLASAVIAALAAVVAVPVGLSWLFARWYARPRRHAPAETPAHHGLPFRPIAFDSGGARIQGWLVPVDGGRTRRPSILLAHGWSGHAAQLLPLARRLHEAGFAVLLYDTRGHGASAGDGPITIRTFAEDLIAALDFVEGQPEVDPSRLGVIGHSIGGAAAILVAAREPRILALVSCAAFADPEALTRDFMRALRLPRGPVLWLVRRFIERWLGRLMAEMSPERRVGEIAVPLLLCHGGSDQFIPPSSMASLRARARPERTEAWLVPGGRHLDVIRDPRSGPRIIEFLSRHLGGKAAAVSRDRGECFGNRRLRWGGAP